jgi:hypothetical protein
MTIVSFESVASAFPNTFYSYQFLQIQFEVFNFFGKILFSLSLIFIDLYHLSIFSCLAQAILKMVIIIN